MHIDDLDTQLYGSLLDHTPEATPHHIHWLAARAKTDHELVEWLRRDTGVHPLERAWRAALEAEGRLTHAGHRTIRVLVYPKRGIHHPQADHRDHMAAMEFVGRGMPALYGHGRYPISYGTEPIGHVTGTWDTDKGTMAEIALNEGLTGDRALRAAGYEQIAASPGFCTSRDRVLDGTDTICEFSYAYEVSLVPKEKAGFLDAELAYRAAPKFPPLPRSERRTVTDTYELAKYQIEYWRTHARTAPTGDGDLHYRVFQ